MYRNSKNLVEPNLCMTFKLNHWTPGSSIQDNKIKRINSIKHNFKSKTNSYKQLLYDSILPLVTYFTIGFGASSRHDTGQTNPVKAFIIIIIIIIIIYHNETVFVVKRDWLCKHFMLQDPESELQLSMTQTQPSQSGLNMNSPLPLAASATPWKHDSDRNTCTDENSAMFITNVCIFAGLSLAHWS